MSQKRQIFHYLLAYVFWVISVGLGLVVVNLWREALILALVLSSSQEPDKSKAFYQSLRIGAVSNWSLVLFGILAIILLVGIESYYRNGVPSGSLWQRFFQITGIECAILLVTHIVYILMQLNFRPFGWISLVVPLVEAVLAALFLWLWINHQKFTKVLRL